MRMRVLLAALVLALAAGGACAEKTVPAMERVLVPGDVIKITVDGEDDLTRTATVEADGTVPLGFPGKARVAGMTTAQAQAAIRLVLRRYLKQPMVTVEITESHYSVMGAVRRAGQFVMQGDHVTVLDALAQAGGPEENANLHTVTLVRRTAAGPARTRLDLQKALKDGGKTEMPVLRSGDVLYVERRGKPLGATLLGIVGAAASLGWLLR